MHLILTATIAPPRGTVARDDPHVRLREYAAALRRWTESPSTAVEKIIFAENSEWEDLAMIREIAKSATVPIEILRAKHIKPPPGIHYGYAELAMIEEVIERTRMETTNGTIFIKATGRLHFPKLDRLLHALPPNIAFAGDGRANMRKKNSIPFIESQLLVFRRDFFYENFANRLGWFQPERGRTHLENFLLAQVQPHRLEPSVVLRFPVNQEPLGIAGNGKRYGSPSRRLLLAARAASRRLAPNVWL